MKNLIVITGANGVGKSTAGKELLDMTVRSAYIDSDWCRAINPFRFTDGTKQAVEFNIFCLMENYLRCDDIDNVIFTYGFHGERKQIFDSIIGRLNKTGMGFELHTIILECDPEENISRMRSDDRSIDSIERALINTMAVYDGYDLPRINTGIQTPKETAEAIYRTIGMQKLCRLLDLGEPICGPESVTGGLMHKMFDVKTIKGRYAVKALNPQIMLRPSAMKNIIDSERIAVTAAKSISAVPAIVFNGNPVQEVNGQYYLVYNWISGKSLKQNEIRTEHCEKVGSVLADLHMIDFSDLGSVEGNSSEQIPVDWDMYLKKGIETNALWVDLLRENIGDLYRLDLRMAEEAGSPGSDLIISHRDLDPKNIIWNNGDPVIIDWESAGYISKAHDLLDTALYWSADEEGNTCKERFMSFLDAYKKKKRIPKTDWDAVLNKGFSGKLGWLKYSLKRSLNIECGDQAEQQMGTENVTGTIKAIRKYADMIIELEEWLRDI